MYLFYQIKIKINFTKKLQTCAEAHLYKIITNNWQFSVKEWMEDTFAM